MHENDPSFEKPEKSAPPIKPDMIKGLRLERKIGIGATSTVYLAHDRREPLNKFAVKVMSSFVASDEEARKRWTREVDLLLKLRHPNIVRGVSRGFLDGRPYLVMEFLQGETLLDRMRRLSRLPEAEVMQVARAILGALQSGHERGIVHRDVKPANLFRALDGTIKLMDFGLAKGPKDEELTQPGMLVGTPIYVSPEQAAGETAITVRSDLYSLGTTLFHLLCGRPPFLELNTSLLLTRKLTTELPDVRTIDPGLGAGVALLIQNLAARLPEHRPDSPAEALKLLDAIEAGSFTSPALKPDDSEVRRQLLQVSLDRVPRDNAMVAALANDKALTANSVLLTRGQVLFYEDEEADDCYVLLVGKVDLLKSGRVAETVSKSGSFLGEMSPLRGSPRTTTAVGRDESVLLHITKEQFDDFFSCHPEMALALARTLAERLDGTGQKLTEATNRLGVLASHVREMAAQLRDIS